MLAEIITIGDEILIGQIIDTNSAYISKQLNNIGVTVFQITSIQDDKDHILKSLKEARCNADIVVITGGLGPTKDDITKKTLTEFFNDVLIQNTSVLKNIESLWEKYIKKPLSQINIDQALVPSKASVLMNLYGSAPGMWIEHEDTLFISLPGVPFEMKALMGNEVIPKLQNKYHLPFIMHKTLMTYGLGESVIANRIEHFENELPQNIKLAYLPNLGRVRLRLSAKDIDKAVVIHDMEHQIKKLIPLIEDVFVGFEDENELEELIGKQLTSMGKTLSTAESCTGGKIAERLTSFSGASSFFKGSIVSYATESKIKVLGVDEHLINTYSVVSKEVAIDMVQKVQSMFDTDYAIATTGNAGPTKGDADVAIGTVYIALATPTKIFAEEFHLGNHRIKVINKAVNKALELLQKEILKN